MVLSSHRPASMPPVLAMLNVAKTARRASTHPTILRLACGPSRSQYRTGLGPSRRAARASLEEMHGNERAMHGDAFWRSSPSLASRRWASDGCCGLPLDRSVATPSEMTESLQCRRAGPRIARRGPAKSAKGGGYGGRPEGSSGRSGKGAVGSSPRALGSERARPNSPSRSATPSLPSRGRRRRQAPDRAIFRRSTRGSRKTAIVWPACRARIRRCLPSKLARRARSMRLAPRLPKPRARPPRPRNNSRPSEPD